MRYRVFDLVMKAVALLPDNDPAGAEIAQSVGNDLRYVDPPYANTAYKALAIRFKETPYGKHAYEKHWFLRDYDPPEPNPDWILKPVQAPGR